MNKTLTAAAGGAAALGLAAFAAREYRRNRSFGCTCYHLTVGPLPLPDAAKHGETVFTIGQAGERRLEGQSAVIRRIR